MAIHEFYLHPSIPPIFSPQSHDPPTPRMRNGWRQSHGNCHLASGVRETTYLLWSVLPVSTTKKWFCFILLKSDRWFRSSFWDGVTFFICEGSYEHRNFSQWLFDLDSGSRTASWFPRSGSRGGCKDGIHRKQNSSLTMTQGNWLTHEQLEISEWKRK